jgi:hypothetical protein
VEEALDLSSDRLLNEMNNVLFISSCLVQKTCVCVLSLCLARRSTFVLSLTI